MRFTIAAFGLAAVASASMSYDDKPKMPVMYAHPNTTTMATTTTKPPMMTTKVVTEFTTYCPSPTVFTHGPSTYTITEATTLTLGCPCTLSVPVYTTETPTSTPVMPVAPPPYYPAKNTTMMMPPPPPTGVMPPPPAGTTPVTPPPVAYTGAANKAALSFGGVLAAAGIIAAL